MFLLPRIGRRRSISLGLLALAIPSLLIFGWMARNDLRTGIWTLSTDGPLDLYYFKAAGIEWYRSDKSFQTVQEDFGREIGWPMQNFEDAPASLQREMTHRAFEIMRNDPLASIIMTLRCFGWLAVVPVRGSLDEFLGTKAGADSYLAASGNVTARIKQMLRSPLLTSLVTLQFILSVFVWVGVARALAGLSHKSSLERILVLVPFALIVLFLLLSSGPESMARYRMPATPMMAIVAASGWFGQFRVARENA
jgi:hypothetical protein